MNAFSRSINIGSNISMSGNKVTINGKTIEIPKGNISVINNKIYVNGKEFDSSDTDLNKSYGTVNIVIEGNVASINCNGSVTINGNVGGEIDCGGSATITGNVEGDIDCGGSVSIKGEHKGSIDAGGSVSIR